jgi:DNA-binding transcriptional LysR family regulator
MNIQNLSVLVILIELKSVSKTASKLNISQPAVTKKLQLLRSYFNDELLIKSGNQMVPTEKSLHIINQIRYILQTLEYIQKYQVDKTQEFKNYANVEQYSSINHYPSNNH